MKDKTTFDTDNNPSNLILNTKLVNIPISYPQITPLSCKHSSPLIFLTECILRPQKLKKKTKNLKKKKKKNEPAFAISVKPVLVI